MEWGRIVCVVTAEGPDERITDGVRDHRSACESRGWILVANTEPNASRSPTC